MAARQGRGEGGRARRRRCARSPRACAWSPCCSRPTSPRRRTSCWRALDADGPLARGRGVRRAARRRPRREARRRFPQAVSDRHATPTSTADPGPRPSWCRPPARPGVRRILTIGIDERVAPRGAGAPPRPTTRCSRRSATTPTTPPATTTRSPRSCASWPPTRAAWRSARPGSTTTATTRPRPDQERAFRAQIELARELGKPLVIHTRAAEDDTIATLAEHADGLEVILHCFSMPDRLEECLRPRLVDLVRRQRHLPEGRGPRRGGRARAARPPAGRDRRAVPHAAAGPQAPQPARVRGPHRARSSPSGAGSPTRSSRRPSRPTPPGCWAGERAPGAAEPAPHAPVRRPAQPRAGPELPDRLQHPRRHRPRRRARPRRRRARGRRRARRAVGVPRRAHRPRARRRARPQARAGPARRARPAPQRDAAPRRRGQARPRGARPGADQGGRQPAVRRRGRGDPAHDRAAPAAPRRGWRWCRRRSASGSRRSPGRPPTASRPCSPSWRADVKVLRPIARTVFHPVPNVDSVLVRLTRHGPAPEPGAAHARPAGLRPPPQGARPLAARSAAATATACAPRSRRWACPPTPAPRRSRPSSGASCTGG